MCSRLLLVPFWKASLVLMFLHYKINERAVCHVYIIKGKLMHWLFNFQFSPAISLDKHQISCIIYRALLVKPVTGIHCDVLFQIVFLPILKFKLIRVEKMLTSKMWQMFVLQYRCQNESLNSRGRYVNNANLIENEHNEVLHRRKSINKTRNEVWYNSSG